MKQPHIIIFPFVAEGHRKPLLCIAQSLSLAGIDVTFVHTNYYHRRFANQISFLSDTLPNLRFESISDGLPDEHPRNLGIDYFVGLKAGAKPHFKKLVLSFHQKTSTRVTCIIADGLMSFPYDIAQDLGIPYFSFHGTGARYALACLNNPKLNIEGSHMIPIPNINMEEDEINIVPGLEGVMQRKDIPHIVARVDTPSLQFLINEMHITTQAIGFILNTFDDLESPCLPHLGTFYNKIYTIGPVHAFLSSKLKHLSKSTTPILAKPEQNCLAWLDSQPTKSVIYVSFGTLLKITRSELLELWHGLVDSGYPFLWAIREDFTLNSEGEKENEVPFNLEMGINGKGFIVSWAPQEQVLNHKSIRGFFTHAGWNSVLESIVAKVPMMYWSGSHVGDLYLNSLCMKKLWRIGIELETLERLKIKEKIKIFMESSPKDDDGIQISVLDKISKSALDAISEGGSSYCNFEELVRVIKNLAKC